MFRPASIPLLVAGLALAACAGGIDDATTTGTPVTGGAGVDATGADPVGLDTLVGSWQLSFWFNSGDHHSGTRGAGYLAFAADGTCTMDVSTTLSSTLGANPRFWDVRYIADGTGSIYVHTAEHGDDTAAWQRNPLHPMPATLLVGASDIVRWPFGLFCTLGDLVDDPDDVDGAVERGRTARAASLAQLLPDRPDCHEPVGGHFERARSSDVLQSLFDDDTVDVEASGDGALRIERRWHDGPWTGVLDVELQPATARTVGAPDTFVVHDLERAGSCADLATALFIDPLDRRGG